MRKQQIFLFVFAITNIYHPMIFGQKDPKVDSMLVVLKTQKDDTSKVNTMNALSMYCGNKEYSLGKRYADDAIALAGKLNFKKGVAIANQNLGNLNASRSNYPDALKYYSNALKLRIEIGNQYDIVLGYVDVGKTNFNLGEYPDALPHLFAALKISEKLCDHYLLWLCNRYLGYVYNRLGKYPLAFSYLLASIKAAEKTGDTEFIMQANIIIAQFFKANGSYTEASKYCSVAIKVSREFGDSLSVINYTSVLGDIYRAQTDYSASLKCHQEVLKIAKEIKHNNSISFAHHNIANTYRSQKDFKTALQHYLIYQKMEEDGRNNVRIGLSYKEIGGNYFEEAKLLQSKPDSTLYRTQLIENAIKNYSISLKLYEQGDFKLGTANCYEDIGSAYRLNNNLQDALKNYMSALSIRKQIGDKMFLSTCYNNIGEIFIELKDFSESRKYLNEGLSLSKEIQSKANIKDSYEHLINLEKASGNWEKVYDYYRLFILYRDSLNNKENTEKMLHLQLQYEYEKQVDSFKYYNLLTEEKLKQQELLAQQQEQSLLLKESELTVLNNEGQLQRFRLQNKESDLAVQKAEAEKKQNQLILLNKEKDIQSLQIKKQKQFRNYLLIGFALLLTIVSFGYYSYRTRQQLKLQTIRNKIAIDLHDDVGSTLSSISIFSQMAQQQSKDVIPLLETIGENSRKMLDAMADIVWTINPENDQFEKIVLRMKSFAYELLGAKGIDFEFLADDDVTKMKLTMEFRKNLYLIFKEATNNMVKYSGASKALFSITGEKNILTMTIKDNGKGFDKERSKSGNGLSNMKKRAEEIGGQLVIDSKVGNGTIVELRIAV